MPKIGFALEYSLGHITHAENLKKALLAYPDIHPHYVDLPYEGMTGAWTRLPVVRSNWSLRASIGAYLGLHKKAAQLDALFYNTQVTSLLSTVLMQRVPSVVSLDATPIQYDSLGVFYNHKSGSGYLEAFKKEMNRNAFVNAKKLVTWSEWAKASLIADYGISEVKITVIPPGVDVDTWKCPQRDKHKEKIDLLFVGGDFNRKGGETLLEAYRSLSADNLQLHIVTKTPDIAKDIPGVSVYYGLQPNSDELRGLYSKADVFVFPTRGDCLPLAIMEALAAGLPVIATDVAAIPEAVIDNVTGLVVKQDNADNLAEAIDKITADNSLRLRLSAGAREHAVKRYNAKTNYGELIALILSVISA